MYILHTNQYKEPIIYSNSWGPKIHDDEHVHVHLFVSNHILTELDTGKLTIGSDTMSVDDHRVA